MLLLLSGQQCFVLFLFFLFCNCGNDAKAANTANSNGGYCYCEESSHLQSFHLKSGSSTSSLCIRISRSVRDFASAGARHSFGTEGVFLLQAISSA